MTRKNLGPAIRSKNFCAVQIHAVFADKANLLRGVAAVGSREKRRCAQSHRCRLEIPVRYQVGERFDDCSRVTNRIEIAG